MSVEHILAKKGRDVISIEPESTLAEAVDKLNRHRIGAAVVVDGSGGLLGILSERDVLRAVAEDGAAALEERVSTRMTSNVVTCGTGTSIDEVMGIMTNGKFRHLPVVEAGKLSGMISIGDIVKHRLAEIEAEHKALKDYITAG